MSSTGFENSFVASSLRGPLVTFHFGTVSFFFFQLDLLAVFSVFEVPVAAMCVCFFPVLSLDV